MTDIIMEGKQRRSMHLFINDDKFQLVIFAEDGSIKVKPLPRHLEEQLKRALEWLSQR